MAIGKHFLDQYSVICVFGSVVGCVVFPLITQSVESLILSAIVISLTAKTLSRKMLTSATEPGNVKDDRRKGKERDKERSKEQEKDSPRLDKKQVKKKRQNNGLTTATDELPHWEEDQKKYEEEQSAEKERRLEERREKKAKKKQERQKRKDEERKEKEREEVRRREKQLVRAQKKQDVETRVTQQLGFTPIKHLSQISELPRRSIHERNGSTSSNSSATTSRSKTKQSRQPVRAASDSILLGTESPTLTPPTSHPSSPSSSTSSKTSPWKPLPSVHITPRWQPDDLFQHQKRVERIVPASQSIHSTRHNPASTHHNSAVVSPTYSNDGISLAGFTSAQPTVVNMDRLSSELIKSQSCESLDQSSSARQCWVPGPASAPTTNLRQIMKEEQTAVMFQQGMSGPLYSLFSGEQSPFSPSLLSGPPSTSRDAWPEL